VWKECTNFECYNDGTYGDHCSLKGQICGRPDFASNLETADSYSVTNSPDMITISGGSLVKDLYLHICEFIFWLTLGIKPRSCNRGVEKSADNRALYKETRE